MSGEKAGERDRTFLLPDDCDCLPPYADCTHGPAVVEGECGSCGESPEDECPKSKRPCGHHCNHVWTHDACDWCGKEFAPTPVPSEVAETTAGEHHPACYQSTGVPDDMPAGLCDCKVLRMLDAAEATAGEREARLVAHPESGKVWVQIPHRNDIGSDWIAVDQLSAPDPDAVEAETLAQVVRPWTMCDDGGGFDHGSSRAAHAILASDWLAALLDRVRREEGAKVLREAADAIVLPGSESSGFYAGEVDAGYREAERHAEDWLIARAESVGRGEKTDE